MSEHAGTYLPSDKEAIIDSIVRLVEGYTEYEIEIILSAAKNRAKISSNRV